MFTRRSFLKRAALAAGGLSAVGPWSGPNLLAAEAAARKLNCVQIGCGIRGMQHLDYWILQGKANPTAIVDVDEKRFEAVKKWMGGKDVDSSKLKTFTDYRVMYDQIGKEIDAVFIATPNHHHAPAARLAMERNIPVYCEKPLCHDISEARQLRAMAAKCKSPTQMGNQGHCGDGYRILCETIWSGMVGNITETHSWTDRSNGGEGPRPPAEPVPAGMHWDDWIGPAPYREFHADLVPHEWHGWYDFGNGSLGNMGCHVLDGVFWALKIEHPTSVELEEVYGGSDERYPMGCKIRYDIPARGDMPAMKAYWYEGLQAGVDRSKTKKKSKAEKGKTIGKEGQNLPPILAKLQQEFPDEVFASNGTIYVGEKGIVYTGTYGEKMHILPLEKWQTMKHAPQTLSRPGDIMKNFLEACRSGKKETEVSFDYGARLTEFVLLGNLAEHAGLHKKVIWDSSEMKTNLPELSKWIQCPARKGWPV